MVATLRMPLQLAGGGLATLEQDTPEEIAQSVALLVQTLPGERRTVPDYGLPSQLGSGVDVDQVAAVVEDWEERATPVLVEQVAAGITQTARVRPAASDALRASSSTTSEV